MGNENDDTKFSIALLNKSFDLIESWREEFNIRKEKRLGFGINLNLKGNDLLESELDVVAEAQ